MGYQYEPHGTIYSAGHCPRPLYHAGRYRSVRGRCTRGGYGWVGTWVGYTGYLPGPSQDPYISLFLRQGPTHGQMKAFFSKTMRFLRLGPRMTSELTQNDLRIDPDRPSRLTSQTGPEMPQTDLPDWSRDVLPENRVFLRFY